MDKFGIFNLLNSFFPLNAQNSEQSSDLKSTNGLANNLISSLGKSLFSQTNTAQAGTTSLQKESKQVLSPHPLQKGMLSTINSHDEFVKRVKEKHEKLTT